MQSQSSAPLQDQRMLASAHSVPRYKQILDWLAPALTNQAGPPPHIGVQLGQAREQILTGLLRVGVMLGSFALLVAILLTIPGPPPTSLLVQATILLTAWVVMFWRHLDYRLRAGVLVAELYIMSCVELMYYGFSQDASIQFLLCALLALLFFNHWVGGIVLALSATTMAGVGTLISTGRFTPLAHPVAQLSVTTMITTCLLFVMIVGSIQAGVALMLAHLDLAWQREYQARRLLEDERDLLEQRVVERTRELALARDQALEASRAEAAQKAYLAALYQTTLDLLNRHDTSDVLQTIVDRSAVVLDAPYGELKLLEADELVVRALTANQPELPSERIGRGASGLSWQAVDSRKPAVLHDPYTDVRLSAAADFPILVGESCVGVLALGRDRPDHMFTADDIQKGTLFAQLVALVLEKARLYDTAVREIDQRLQAEQALQRQALDLQAQNAELDAFAHTVAHDLRSPLTGVIGHSQLLLELQAEMTAQEVDQSLGAIMQGSQKMSTIIDALLLLSRVHSHETMPYEALPMRSVVAEAVARLQPAISAASATIIYPESWPAAIGYAPWVEEVWVNYLSNAIKYGGEPPIITLGAELAAPGFVRFWVRDNGAGLSLAQQSQLFTPFTRLHTDRADGQGLGLSIVQRITTKLGGSVGVESTLGQCTTFSFTLPQDVGRAAPCPGQLVAY